MSKWETGDGIETDDEGRLINFVTYGEGDDAALYSRRCTCGRFVKPEPTARINEIVNEAFGNCTRCGRVRLAFICFAGDARRPPKTSKPQRGGCMNGLFQSRNLH